MCNGTDMNEAQSCILGEVIRESQCYYFRNKAYLKNIILQKCKTDTGLLLFVAAIMSYSTERSAVFFPKRKLKAKK